MLSCKQITWIVASGQLEDASWLRRLSTRMHFFMCRHCRRYESQIQTIRAMARKAFGSAPDDPAALRRLEGEVLSHIPGGANPGPGGEAKPPYESD